MKPTEQKSSRNYCKIEDEERWSSLMAKAVKGDKKSYQVLLSELANVIEAYLHRKFSLDFKSNLLDDCIQDVLIALHEARHTYDPTRPFRPWFFSIVKYKSIDALRKYKTHQARNSDTFEETISDQEDDLNTDINQCEAKMTFSALAKSIPDIYRETIAMAKIEGLSIAEVAKRMDTTESAVKVRIHRGLQKIKKAWQNESKR